MSKKKKQDKKTIRTLFSFATRLAAQAPHARKTIPRPRPARTESCEGRFAPPYLSMTSTTLSVNSSQPLPEWEPASLAFTVRAVLRSNTPFCAHAVKFLYRSVRFNRGHDATMIYEPMLRNFEFRVLVQNFFVDLPTTPEPSSEYQRP